jgi:hypothetical protein
VTVTPKAHSRMNSYISDLSRRHFITVHLISVGGTNIR